MKDPLKLAKKIMENDTGAGRIPCAAVALVTKKDSYSCFRGYASLTPQKELLEEHSIFDLASLTKVVSTTTLALQCLERGLFSLKTPVQSILPDFPYDMVTVGQIMTHTSGICHDDKQYKQLKSKEEMRPFFFKKPLEFTPGSRVVYSDFGYIALGYIIEAVLGPLDREFERNVAVPLGMKDTGYCPSDRGLAGRCVPTEVTPERGKIQGQVHDGKANLLCGVSGNAGLFSTLEDLTKFVQMMLQDGKYQEHTIIEKASVDLLKTCATSGQNERRTLGWWSDEPTMSFGDYYSDCCIYHTGFTGTSMYIDFKRQCGIIILTNRIHPSRENPYIKEFRNLVHNAILVPYERGE